jgi:hypothetical protein
MRDAARLKPAVRINSYRPVFDNLVIFKFYSYPLEKYDRIFLAFKPDWKPVVPPSKEQIIGLVRKIESYNPPDGWFEALLLGMVKRDLARLDALLSSDKWKTTSVKYLTNLISIALNSNINVNRLLQEFFNPKLIFTDVPDSQSPLNYAISIFETKKDDLSKSILNILNGFKFKVINI